MPEGASRADFVLTRAGSQAIEILTAGGRGRIVALFDRSFYIAFDQGLICLGLANLPMGPLNVRSSVPPGATWQARGLRNGDGVELRANGLRVGRALRFDFAGVARWDPPAPPRWTARSLSAGLAGLDRLARQYPAEGLAALIPANRRGAPGNAFISAARPSVDCLSRALERAYGGAAPQPAELDHAVTALLGLGPGLTPSGDDLLGGVLVALAAVPAPAFRRLLLGSVARHARQRTNAISVAHLRAAGAGACHASLHDVLNNLLAGDAAALPAGLAAIDGIGHSSGWDTLAGLCVTLRAYLSAQKAAEFVTG